jgi:hypothetical protein
MMRITKIVGEKRQAKWVGLKYKALGLAQSYAQAFPTDLVIGPDTKATAHKDIPPDLVIGPETKTKTQKDTPPDFEMRRLLISNQLQI